MTQTTRFEHLDVEHVGALRSLCGGCVYWEFPRAFDEGVTAERALEMKSRWLCCHRARFPLGRVARVGEELLGFFQFGPSELYPRCLDYMSGPVSRDAWLITCLFVGSDHRGKGVGRSLVGEALEAARAARCHALESFVRRGSVNNPSGPIEFYQSCGYVVERDDSEFPLVRLEIGGA